MAKQVVLGVTGSIAAYKAVEVLRLMTGKGWSVSVVMTRNATQFIAPLTFRTLSNRPVGIDMFAEVETWQPEHISLADQADVMVIAPCSANVLAKLAHGLADDLLTSTALALRAPLVVAPAMNVNMWEHAATQANVGILQERGVVIVDVESGDLACGYQGKGRLASPERILAAVAACPPRPGERQA